MGEDGLMDECINREATLMKMWKALYDLEDKIEQEQGLDIIRRLDIQAGFEAGQQAVVSMPAAHVQPVVRCKDCMYWQPKPTSEEYGDCERDRLIRWIGFSCDAGKRNKDVIRESPTADVVPVVRCTEEQGLLVRLPCKVGETVFSAFEDEDVFCGKVYAISICDGTNWFSVRYDSGLRYDHTWDDFGKTVFLSREEAEATLKEERKDV